jgi:putative ABC transport system substrate-binding protein
VSRSSSGRRLIVVGFTATSIAFCLLSVSVAQNTQRSAKVHRIGVLSTRMPERLRESLRELGYVEGRNAVLEVRETEGRADRVDDLARELLRSKVDVIVATYPAAALAAKRATTTIPIVMVNNPDPVHLGLVASLARPGGNITGTTSLSADVSVKQLQILQEAVARTSRIAVLWNPDNPWHPAAVKALHGESRSLSVQVQTVPVRRPEELDNSFEAMTRERAQAVLVLADPMTFFHRKRLAELAIKHRLPLMGGLREYTEAGGLMSYWADEGEQFRNVARYVDKILKGAKPADLPIEQPSKYELVINLRTASALSLTMPPTLLLRASVIE